MEKLGNKLAHLSKLVKVSYNNKDTRSLRYGIYYGRNDFYDTGPTAQCYKKFTSVIYEFSY